MDRNIEDENFWCNLVTFIKGSLVFVVSQAWNTAIQDKIAKTHFLNNSGQLVYALTITFISVYLLKLFAKLGRIIEKCNYPSFWTTAFGGGRSRNESGSNSRSEGKGKNSQKSNKSKIPSLSKSRQSSPLQRNLK